MHLIDWIVLLVTLGLIVGYGVYKTRTSASAGELLSGSKNVGAMTIGLGIMATQASAITFLSTPGQLQGRAVRADVRVVRERVRVERRAQRRHVPVER